MSIPRTIGQALFRNKSMELLARSAEVDDFLSEMLITFLNQFSAEPTGTLVAFAAWHPKASLIIRAGENASHVLLLPPALYRVLGDPFLVAERFPPAWHSRGELPTLEWPDEALPRRTVERVQEILRTGDGPTLLGAAQALVDGGRVVFERPTPDPDILRVIWALLPDSTRGELSLATHWSGSADEQVNAIVVPPGRGKEFVRYLQEQHAGDYPEGRYELNLQIAAEAGDQVSLDRLFARRSGRQTLRLALIIFGVMLIVGAIMRFVFQ